MVVKINYFKDLIHRPKLRILNFNCLILAIQFFSKYIYIASFLLKIIKIIFKNYLQNKNKY